MKEPKKGLKKIKIGRLKVDPIFLVIFSFFTLTALLWFIFLLVAGA